MPRYYTDSAGEWSRADTPEEEQLAVEAGLTPKTYEEFQQEGFRRQAEERKAVEAQARAQYDIERGALSKALEATKAGLEAYGRTMLPFGIYEKAQQALGIPLIEQQMRAEDYPTARLLGTIGGLGATLAVTGGVAGAAKAAGVGAAELAAAAGAGRVGQALAAAKSALVAPGAVAETAAPLASLAGRVGGAVGAGVETLLPAARGTALAIPAGIAAGAAAVGTEASLLGLGQEVNESILEDRPLAGEALLHTALLAGGIGGILGGAAPAARLVAQSELGKELAATIGKTRAERVINKFDSSQAKIAAKQIGRERYYGLINEALDQGLVPSFGGAKKLASVAEEQLDRAGKAIGQIADEAAARTTDSTRPDMTRIFERMSDEVADKLAREYGASREEASRYVIQQINDYARKIPAEPTVKDLARIRTDISQDIYGLRGSGDPLRSFKSRALRDIRHILTDEIGKGMEEAGISPAIWKVPQRQYEIASRLEDLAEGAAAAQAKAPVDTAAVGVVTAALKGLGKGALAATGYSLGKRALTKGYEWTVDATLRALESGAPKPLVQDLQALSEQQAAAAAAGLPLPALKPDTAARAETWDVQDILKRTVRSLRASGAPSRLVDDLSKVHEDLFYGYRGTMDPDKAAQLLEDANKQLAKLSRTRADVDLLQQQAVIDAVRAIRATINAKLSDPSLWGEVRAAKAADELRTIIGTRTDPERIAALHGIQSTVSNLTRKSTTKLDELVMMPKATIKRLPKHTATLKNLTNQFYEAIEPSKVMSLPEEEVSNGE